MRFLGLLSLTLTILLPKDIDAAPNSLHIPGLFKQQEYRQPKPTCHIGSFTCQDTACKVFKEALIQHNTHWDKQCGLSNKTALYNTTQQQAETFAHALTAETGSNLIEIDCSTEKDDLKLDALLNAQLKKSLTLAEEEKKVTLLHLKNAEHVLLEGKPGAHGWTLLDRYTGDQRVMVLYSSERSDMEFDHNFRHRVTNRFTTANNVVADEYAQAQLVEHNQSVKRHNLLASNLNGLLLLSACAGLVYFSWRLRTAIRNGARSCAESLCNNKLIKIISEGLNATGGGL